MRILTTDEIRKVEQNCFEYYLTEGELMFRAGNACFERIKNEYDIKGKSVSVLCGNGKNAGDGFVIARLLYAYGAKAKIVICDKMPEIAEPKEYFNQAVSSGVCVEFFDGQSMDCDFIVDCMFGIGFHGEARAPFDRIFASVRSSRAVIISVDTPSGTDAATGRICSNCVKADYTIAISTLKYCHVLPPANDCCGKIDVVDIGIPTDCYSDCKVNTIELDEIKRLFKKTNKNANKGTFGHQLNICSSYKMFGAGVIATKAALRSGAGLVKLALPVSAYPLAAAHLVQPIFNPVRESSKGTFCAQSIPDLKADLDWADSVVLGCGIGKNKDTEKFVSEVIKNTKSPIIIDADGINCLKQSISIFKDIKAPVVLTPHPGEMARLVSKSVAEIQEDRINTAKEFAGEYGVILVLKGANTIVTDGDNVFVNMTGNPSMAMGGSGDMLSGMIGAFVCQGIQPFDAAKAAVYIHGLSGDCAAEAFSQRGILVSDMIDQLAALMSQFE